MSPIHNEDAEGWYQRGGNCGMPLTPIVVSSIFIRTAFGPVPDSKGVKRDARQSDDFRSVTFTGCASWHIKDIMTISWADEWYSQ